MSQDTPVPETAGRARPCFGFLAQLTLLLVSVFLLSGAVVLYSTYQGMGQAVLDREEASIDNIAHFIRLNIQNAYDQFLYAKVDEVRRLKENLRSQVRLCIAIHSVSGPMALASLEEDTPRARAAAMRLLTSAWFDSPLLDPRITWFVYDQHGRVIDATDDWIRHADVTRFIDFKGRPLWERLQVGSMPREGEFAVFQDSPEDPGRATRLGFFMPLPRWGMCLGAAMDVSALAREEQRRAERIVADLGEDFADLRIARTGFVMLFDKTGRILVPPGPAVPAAVVQALDTARNPELFQKLARPGRTELDIDLGDGPHPFAVWTAPYKGFGWYSAIVLPMDELRGPAMELVARQSRLVLAIFVTALTVCLLAVTRLTQPLRILTEQIHRLTGTPDFTGPECEEIMRALPVDSRNEAGRLARAFRMMLARLRENVRALMETTARNERMKGELSVARDIQIGTLPLARSLPPRDDLDLAPCLVPAREVGGDLYDFFFIDQDLLCFALGDVADKGAPAALFMVTTKVLIKSTARDMRSPAAILGRVNDILCQDNLRSMFVTLVIGVLDLKSGQLSFVNAGHNPPIRISAGGRATFLEEKSGPVAGALPGIDYAEFSLALAPGEALLLYTDGVPEAMNSENEPFGEERLVKECERLAHREAADFCAELLDEVRGHAAGAPQSDDIAMLMIRWRPRA